MNENQKKAKVIRGINYTDSGSISTLVIQKNGVIRAQLLRKRKQGSEKR